MRSRLLFNLPSLPPSHFLYFVLILVILGPPPSLSAEFTVSGSSPPARNSWSLSCDQLSESLINPAGIQATGTSSWRGDPGTGREGTAGERNHAHLGLSQESSRHQSDWFSCGISVGKKHSCEQVSCGSQSVMFGFTLNAL